MHDTLTRAVDEANRSATQNQLTYAVHLVGPSRYVVALFLADDVEKCRTTLLQTIDPNGHITYY